ncbi:MAG: hypothetical protein Q9171_003293 [Xanthocarpia ochracea]
MKCEITSNTPSDYSLHQGRFERLAKLALATPTPTFKQHNINTGNHMSANDFYEIMDMLDKRLNDKGKNWRHVLKSLKVLDYCLHEGSELVVTWARKNVYIIKTLREFQYVDDDGRDVGNNGE